MFSRVVLVLSLLLLVPLSARGAPPETVTVRQYPGPEEGRRLVLTFRQLGPEPALTRFSVEEARAFVEALEIGFQVVGPRSMPPSLAGAPVGVVRAGMFLGPLSDAPPSDLERRVRAAFVELQGPSSLPLAASLENSRWFQALKLSPRYMDEGVREAAMELLTSPTVAYSMAVSMMLYMAAWAAPEPVFSKALAAAVTLGLLMTYSAVELHTVGVACLNLYREAEAAKTQEQLEAVAERFGKAIGGVGLRVLVTVAGAKLAKGLPEVPRGGLWARLSPPRFAFGRGGGGGGFTFGAGARAQVSVADGTVVLMGVSANTTASALASVAASARTTGDCRDASNKGDAKAHHLATDKNDISDASGGPWTPRFKDLFDRAGMSFDDPANIVYLVGHVGPHPKDYHEAVFSRLRASLGDCRLLVDCRSRLTKALDMIAGEVCTSGSKLNKLATRRP
ncbi:AHH domain-containing protein [Archangium violaceum]|uniref:AHH domain-containing protein n=1 Tax=Archangium violaceum TaxID=83451 RepID=UPI001951F51E|nr:AHH domain-containing protein [Archangium violaceum]